MGNFWSLIRLMWNQQVERRVLMLGLDNAGKTTILFNLKLGEVLRTIPTIGFNVDTVTYKNINFTVWDVGGQLRIRALWKHYFTNTSALIYVVDSTETEERFDEAKMELQRLLEDYELQGVPLLVFCNKQDMQNAAAPSYVVEKFNLHSIKGRAWHVQACTATRGDGLYEGLDWLASQLNRR